MKQTRAAKYDENGKIIQSCVEACEAAAFRGHFVRSGNVDFISPIDGSHIRNSQQLVDHNKRHGVSNDLDSRRQQTADANKPMKLSKTERRDDINDAIERASSSGFSRRVNYE